MKIPVPSTVEPFEWPQPSMAGNAAVVLVAFVFIVAIGSVLRDLLAAVLP